MTDKERASLDALAKTEGLKTSTYARKVLGLDGLSSLTDNDLASPPIENASGMSRDRKVSVFFSEDEFNRLKDEVDKNSTTISNLIRQKTLTKKTIVSVDVYDEDIVDLENRIQPQLDRLLNIIKAFKVQKVIHDSQFNQIKSILTDIYNEIRFLARKTFKDRRSIRQAAIRELNKKCDRAAKKKVDIKVDYNSTDE